MSEPHWIEKTTPFVGRSAELLELDSALAKALRGQGCESVLLVGGAGLGKTRLLEEFQHTIEKREHTVRVFRAAAKKDGDLYEVWSEILRQRFEISDSTDAALVKSKLESAVKECLGDDRIGEYLHFLGDFCGVQFPDSALVRALEGEPGQYTRVGRTIVRNFLEADAEKSPLVLILEDLHLATEDCLELAELVFRSVHKGSLLLVLSGHTDLLSRRHGWVEGSRSSKRHPTKIELMPLSRESALQWVTRALPDSLATKEQVAEVVVDHAGGNPYLSLQMLRSLVRGGAIVEDDSGVTRVVEEKLKTASLPLSLEEATQARIASITAEERSLLEHAAVIGTTFWLSTLVSLGRTHVRPPELWGGAEDLAAQYRSTLQTLVQRGFLVQHNSSSAVAPADSEYAFVHNLERDALYRHVGISSQRRLHAQVAEWLECRFAQQDEHADALAHHFAQGGDASRAATYYLRAAERARQRYANARASELYSKGLEALGTGNILLRLESLHNWGDTLQLLGDNDQALAVFRQMLELAYRVDLRAKGGVAHNRIGRVYRAVGRLEEAMRHLGTGLALFESVGDERGAAASYDDIGKVHWMRGDYAASETFIQKSLTMRNRLSDSRGVALCLNNMGLVYQDSGRFEEAERAFLSALQLRREIQDSSGIAQTLNNLGTIHQDRGDHPRAIVCFKEALEIMRQIGDTMHQAVILTNLGEAMYREGQPEGAIDVLRDAEELSQILGDRILEGEILRGLAKAHLLRKDFTEAKALIRRSVDLFEQSRGKPFLAVALRTAGEIAGAASFGGEGQERAKEYFERAIRIFEELGNDAELSRTFRAFAALLEGDPMRKEATSIEAARLLSRAGRIDARIRASGSH